MTGLPLTVTHGTQTIENGLKVATASLDFLSVLEPQALPLATQVLPLGNYRNDIAYTGALKSTQALPLGNYRNDIAYTGALKSIQVQALGSYRQDIAYTGALKSIQTVLSNTSTISSFVFPTKITSGYSVQAFCSSNFANHLFGEFQFFNLMSVAPCAPDITSHPAGGPL